MRQQFAELKCSLVIVESRQRVGDKNARGEKDEKRLHTVVAAEYCRRDGGETQILR